MERLKKRCFAASFSGHSLLLLALLLGPLLIPKSVTPAGMPVITYIPANILDGIVGTGGQPGGGSTSGNNQPSKRMPPPKPQDSSKKSIASPPLPDKPEIPRTTQPQESQSKLSNPRNVQETKIEAEARPLPKAVIPDLTPIQKKKAQNKRSKDSEPQFEKEAPAETGSKTASKSAVQPNLKLAKSQANEGAEKTKRDRELAEASRRASEERGSLVNSVAEKIGSSIGAGLSIQGLSSIGNGIGGDGYANYGQVLMAIYQKAWMEPAEVDGSQHVVQTEVVVARDGRVISRKIVKRCRSETVNQSVQRALDRVLSIAPFPSGMNEPSKTFLLDFDLQSKRNAG